VAARLLPPSGGPLGARVALLEVTGGVGKRAFSLSSLSFLVSGFTPRGQGGDGAGEGGSRPRASDHLSDDSCAGGDDPKTVGSARLASSPTLPWCFFVSKTHGTESGESSDKLKITEVPELPETETAKATEKEG